MKVSSFQSQLHQSSTKLIFSQRFLFRTLRKNAIAASNLKSIWEFPENIIIQELNSNKKSTSILEMTYTVWEIKNFALAVKISWRQLTLLFSTRVVDFTYFFQKKCWEYIFALSTLWQRYPKPFKFTRDEFRKVLCTLKAWWFLRWKQFFVKSTERIA